MRFAAVACILCAPLACGRTESSREDDQDASGSGGEVQATGGARASDGGSAVFGGRNASGGAAASGGRTDTGGAGVSETGGASSSAGGASGGQVAASGGKAAAGGEPSGGAAGAGGGLVCDCELEKDAMGEARSCETFGGSLGSDANVWLCHSTVPSFQALQAAGCEGLPTGLFRVCCPKEVELEAICAR
jgi:hypothetical protein